MPVNAKCAWMLGSAVFGLAFSIASGEVGFASGRMTVAQGRPAQPGFLRVGHDNIVVDPTIRRYSGMVSGLGTPDAQGKLYTFTLAPVGPRNFPLSQNDLRGWRLTMLSGKRFGEVFRIKSNASTEVTVTADNGTLDGLAANDILIIESIDENGASMFGPAAGAGAATAPGT